MLLGAVIADCKLLLGKGYNVKVVSACVGSNLSCKLGGDDSFDECTILGESACFLLSSHNIVCKKDTDLVASEQDKLAFKISHCNAHTVCIGVGCDYKCTANTISNLYTKLKVIDNRLTAMLADRLEKVE